MLVRVTVAVLVAAGVAAVVVHTRTGDRPVPGAAVDSRVLADTAGGRTAHFLVRLRGQADVARAVAGAHSRAAQGALAVAALRRAAARQTAVESELRRLGVAHRSFWVVNAVAVVGGRRIVDVLAARPDVARIEADRTFRGVALEAGREVSAAPRGVEWNVLKIGAPSVWALGFTGQGLVYANADTGVTWDVPALRAHYRGWDGAAAGHAYNWWDAVHGDISGNGSNPCGFNLVAPCDDDKFRGISHGTHTMATAVGDDGSGNQVGVAPGAKWIACRNMDEGVGRPSTYIECLQFFLAPTDLSGANPDPSKRPNAIGNAYACPPKEECSVGSLQAAVDNVRAAGIFMAVAAGNEGAGCSTVAVPPGTYDSSTSVGATDAGDRIASFSSRGPVTADGSGRLKPDLTAPGVDVRSSTSFGYAIASGTSMATPHVGASALLLWSAFPALRGNVDATEQLLERSAVHLTTAQGCGGDSTSAVPNNTFGYGRLDVYAAYRAEEAAQLPDLGVADVTVREGDLGRRSVVFTLTRAGVQPVTVSYATRGGTARSGVDFVPASGSVSLGADELSARVAVQVIGDRLRERDESFTLELSNVANARLVRPRALATILDDDADHTKPVLTGLRAVTRKRGTGAALTVQFRASEAVVVSCTVERRHGGAWRRLRGFGRAVPAGSIRLRAPFGVPPGSFRLRCVPRDRAGNVGIASLSAFSVAP